MKLGERRKLTVRLFAEFLAIFAGAAVALTVDGWAERRSETQEAQAGLALVLSDLEQDSAQFAAVRSKMGEWADATAWLLLAWGRPDFPADSVALAFDALTQGEALQLSTVGFDGLRDSNRLRFIENRAVVRGLREYYQVRQTQIRDSFDKTIELVDGLPKLAATHLEYGSDESTRARWQPLATGGVRLRHPWVAITQDPVLHQSLVWFGRWTGYVVQLLEESEAELGALLEDVRREVDA
jgi:hypothetical protein